MNQTDILASYDIIQRARLLASENSLLDLQKNIELHLSYIEVQKTAISIHENVKKAVNTEPAGGNITINTVLNYLDVLIEDQQSKINISS